MFWWSPSIRLGQKSSDLFSLCLKWLYKRFSLSINTSFPRDTSSDWSNGKQQLQTAWKGNIQKSIMRYFGTENLKTLLSTSMCTGEHRDEMLTQNRKVSRMYTRDMRRKWELIKELKQAEQNRKRMWRSLKQRESVFRWYSERSRKEEPDRGSVRTCGWICVRDADRTRTEARRHWVYVFSKNGIYIFLFVMKYTT